MAVASLDTPPADAAPDRSDGTAGHGSVLASRPCAVAILGLLAVVAAVAVAPERPAAWAAARVLLPAAVFGLVPGLLLTLAALPRLRWRLPGLLGVGIALSMGLAQLPTLVGMGAGLPTMAVALGYAALLAVAAVALLLRRAPLGVVTATRGELLVLLAVTAVATIAYVKGSPFFSDEEQIHISIIRRIVAEDAPGRHNIFPAANVAYTHPYPGTHYFMALVTALGREDALFVYHKLRACWTFAALLLLYLLARRIFEDAGVAAATLAAAIALVLNGCYADFFSIFWGQLAPFSHPSDVAMAVLLPGLLLVALHHVDAADRRRGVFFFGAFAIVALMVTMVHIRETVQFLVYAACLLPITILRERSRVRTLRVVGLIGAAAAMAAGYGVLHRHLVPHVADFDTSVKAQLLDAIRNGSWDTLVRTPFPFHETTLFFSLFYGWNAVVLLASPLVCLAFARRPLVLMMGLAIVVYLVILRVPLLSMLYTYATHADMLVTPVRNVSLFVYLLTGPLLYLVVCQVRRQPVPGVSVALALVAAWGLACAANLGWSFWLEHYDAFFGPMLALYAVAGGVLACRRLPEPPSWPSGWRPRVLFVLVVAAAAGASGMWERSLLSLHHVTTYSPFLGDTAPVAWSAPQLLGALRPVVTPHWDLASTNSAFADYKVALDGNLSAPPSAGLLRWARTELPAGAVLATNGMNAYPLPVFLPQRIACWPPIVSFNLSYPRQLAPTYYALMDRAVAMGRRQPFFNPQETLDERLDFLDRTGSTHVVLDPPSRGELRGILAHWPEHFRCVYDDGAWAVYAVNPHPFGE